MSTHFQTLLEQLAAEHQRKIAEFQYEMQMLRERDKTRSPDAPPPLLDDTDVGETDDVGFTSEAKRHRASTGQIPDLRLPVSQLVKRCNSFPDRPSSGIKRPSSGLIYPPIMNEPPALLHVPSAGAVPADDNDDDDCSRNMSKPLGAQADDAPRRSVSGTRNLNDDESSDDDSSGGAYISKGGVVQPLFRDCVPEQWREALREATHGSSQDLGTLGVDKEYLSSIWEQRYDLFVGFLIFCNAIFIGWQVQYKALWREIPTIDYVGGVIFCILFCVDIAYRLSKERRNFFLGVEKYWNLFDSVIVCLMVVEECFRLADLSGSAASTPIGRFAILRTFRLLRFVRILHAVRVLKVFREFRLLVNTMLCGSRAMIWVMIITVSLAFVAGISLTEGTYDACGGKWSGTLCSQFGTLDRSLLSLYEAMFGGLLWGELMHALLELDAVYPILFVILISFVLIILINTVTAVVLEMEADLKKCPEAKVREKKDAIHTLSIMFDRLDPNNSGDISLSEIQHAFDRDTELEGALAALQLEVNDDAKTFFSMLDRDNTGVIQKSEFVLGCLRLKGEAKAIDVVRVQQCLVEMRETQKSMASAINALQQGECSRPEIEDTPRKGPSGTSGNVRVNRGRSVKVALDALGAVKCPSQPALQPLLSVGGGCRIPKTEERAMSLKELRALVREIKRRCPTELWCDQKSGESLETDRVNLYHLNYNHICPLTTPKGVILKGLSKRKYTKGQRVTQNDPSGNLALPIAEGVVAETVHSSTVSITISRGMFGERKLVMVDDVECGEPDDVHSPDALSYKELVSTGSLAPRWFCCHWWGEIVRDFVACCEEHTKLRDKKEDEASFWVCAYANCQHDLGADITVDPENSSFRRAMRLAEGILLVLDPDATPFRRIWCDFELYKTIGVDKKLLDIVTFYEDKARLISQDILPHETTYYKSLREQQFPIRLLVEGMCRPLEDGDASVSLDKQRILESMARDVPITALDAADSYDARLALALKRANNALHAYFAISAWSFAVNNAIVQDFDQMNPGTLDLADVLSKDEERQRLTLTLAHSKRIVDHDVQVLAHGLPPNLVELTLSFDGCPNITDAGVKELAAKLPYGLRGLKLDFSSCKEITDLGLRELIQALPEGVQELELYFAHCHEVSINGAADISAKLPPNLMRFAFNLTGTKVNKNFESAQQLRKFVAKHKGGFMGAMMKGSLGRETTK